MIQISIHTLRMEGDGSTRKALECKVGFQSTPSAWRVTITDIILGYYLGISIHTLRMEGDRDK